MKKLITIIGAGPGISQGIAERFGQENFRVVLMARNESKLKDQVSQLTGKGIEAHYVVGDASNKESLKNALSTIQENHGHADVIVYNAAIISFMDILDQEWETIKTQMDTNVGGFFNLMKMVLPQCIKENKGKLFVTNGGFALSGDDQWTSLSVGKAALRNLVQAFQKKVANTNIHIAQVTVCGYVSPENPKHNPASIAENYWRLYQQEKGHFENEIIY